MSETVIDNYITKASLDTRDYDAGARRVMAANAAMNASLRGQSWKGGWRQVGQGPHQLGMIPGGGGPGGPGSGFPGFMAPGGGSGRGAIQGQVWGNRLSGVQGAFSGVGGLMAQGAQAFVAELQIAGAAAAALGTAMLYASRQAADFEALVKSLESLEGSAGLASEELKRLKEIAKRPAIGFGEATQGYIGLRNANISSGFSERLILAFANANAKAGGGKEVFSRIMLALTQIATSPFIRGQELRQLAEARIPAYGMLQKLYGTTDTRELKRRGITSTQALTEMLLELEKLPVVTGGAKNSWDNLMDAIHYGIVDVGNGINQTLSPALQNIADVMNSAGKGGLFTSLGEGLMNNIGNIFGDLGNSDVVETLLVNIYAGIRTLGDLLQNLILNLKEGFSALLGPLANLIGFSAVGESNFEGYRNEARQMIELGKKKDKKDAEEFAKETKRKLEEEGGVIGAGNNPAIERLDKIERHTRRTSEIMKNQYDRSQSIIGGGSVGGFGVSAIEIAGFKGNLRGKAKIHSMISELMMELGSTFYVDSRNKNIYDTRAGVGG